MSRPSGSVKTPSYCRHSATDQAYVTISGKEIYLGRYNSKESREKYNRVVGEFLSNGRQSPLDATAGTTPGLTVSALLAAFWNHAKLEYPAPDVMPGKRPTGELGNFWDVMKPLKRLYGSTAAADFGPRALKALRAELVKLDWCRNTINRQISRVRHIFRWGVSNELIPSSIIHGLDSVAGLRAGRSDARETEPVKPVPDHVLADTLPHLNRHVRAMAELQVLTGMRSGEVCAMQTKSIDTSGKVWLYRPTAHKTAWRGHDRIVRIGQRAQALLQPFLKTDLNAYIFSPVESEKERRDKAHAERKTPASSGNYPGKSRKRKRLRDPGDHYTTRSYRRAISRAIDAADIDPWHPHQLRHNFATRIRRDYGPEVALVLLGDKTTRMVDVYAAKDATTAEKVINEVG